MVGALQSKAEPAKAFEPKEIQTLLAATEAVKRELETVHALELGELSRRLEAAEPALSKAKAAHTPRSCGGGYVELPDADETKRREAERPHAKGLQRRPGGVRRLP